MGVVVSELPSPNDVVLESGVPAMLAEEEDEEDKAPDLVDVAPIPIELGGLASELPGALVPVLSAVEDPGAGDVTLPAGLMPDVTGDVSAGDTVVGDVNDGIVRGGENDVL